MADYGFPNADADQVWQVFASWQAGGPITREAQVTDAVQRAATDPSCPMRLPAGNDALALAEAGQRRNAIRPGA